MSGLSMRSANLPHDKIALCVLQVSLESVIRQQEEYIETANRHWKRLV